MTVHLTFPSSQHIMGMLSKLTSTAGSSLTIGAVLAKTASLATFSALDTGLQTSKLATDQAFSRVEDIVKLAEEVLESSGMVGDRVTNIAFVTAIMMAKMMPGQIGNMVRMLKIVNDEVIEQIFVTTSSQSSRRVTSRESRLVSGMFWRPGFLGSQLCSPTLS